MSEEKIYIETPLIESVQLRKYSAGRRVYLKLENCQPSGSFKLRGVSELCRTAMSQGYEEMVCPSGGNAGLATAYSAMKLGLKCRIVLSKKSSASIVETLIQYGATVETCGQIWEESFQRAKKITDNSKTKFLVHPFDHWTIWEGHSTIIDEIANELKGVVPSIIVTSCGGGGLTCGLNQGIRRNQWENQTKVLVMETEGAHSLNSAVKNGGQPNKINISSMATCLVANVVCDQVAKNYLLGQPPLLSRVITDSDAARAVIKFANDHRILVGLACGAAISALYTGTVERLLAGNEDQEQILHDKYSPDWVPNQDGPIVVLVCGGSEIVLSDIENYRKLFNLTLDG